MKNATIKFVALGLIMATIIGSGLIFVLPAFAAKVVGFSDAVTDNAKSAAVNHTMQFTTPSGLAAGETMELTFPAAFNLGSVDYTDIDVADDGLDLSLAAAPAGATWGVTVVGSVITIISGAGIIAAGSVVTIEIGTNATFQNFGDQQIINPSSNGSYGIFLAGTFADFGDCWVVIFDNVVGVNASVLPVTPPGGGDSSPPIISNVQIINITEDSATVTWLTNEAATSIVDYGFTLSYEKGSVNVVEYVTFHSLDLINLEPDTLYHLRVISRDASGNMSVSGDYTFRTLSTEDLFLNFRAVPEKRLPPTGNNSTILRVKMYQEGTENLVFDQTATTDLNGYSNDEISLQDVTLSATYDFLIKGYSHLQHRKNGVTMATGTEFIDFSEGETIFEKAGDVNGTDGDNYVNGIDLSILGNHIYTDDYRNDLNQDDLVNGLEFSIAVTNLYQWGDF